MSNIATFLKIVACIAILVGILHLVTLLLIEVVGTPVLLMWLARSSPAPGNPIS